jgi:large subunit ribosomal protein L35
VFLLLLPGRKVDMPKMKSNRSAMKRFKKTATGKVKRRRAYKAHLLTKKASSRKRRLRKNALVSKADRKRVERLIFV